MTSSLRARLVRYYAAALVIVLVAFAGVVWGIIELEEANEPPEVAALEPPEHTDRNLALALGGALLVIVPLAALGGAVVARRGLAPLDQVIATAARVSTDRLSERVTLAADAPTEIAALATSVNAMLARLEVSVDGMRRFTADASHELRTPLAAMIAELEITLRHERDVGALRESVGNALESLQGMARLVETLLAIAQADASALPISATSLELGATVRAIVAPYEEVVASRNVRLELEVDEHVRARADALWVRRIVSNLLDNAVRHTPEGGVLTVRVLAGPRVEVEDSGAGVVEPSRLFERFHRGVDARASGHGFGLGLALSRQIARALGGELAYAGGSRFVLTLLAA